MTKLRKHATAFALVGMLALFGTACASDDGGSDGGGESEAGTTSSEAAS